MENGNVLSARQNMIEKYNAAINIKKFFLIDQNLIGI
jgi:hypothetical protein